MKAAQLASTLKKKGIPIAYRSKSRHQKSISGVEITDVKINTKRVNKGDICIQWHDYAEIMDRVEGMRLVRSKLKELNLEATEIVNNNTHTGLWIVVKS